MMTIENSNVLLVKHLPGELTSNEKSELLKCFGAREVRVMPIKGQFKHSAFATFLDHNEARHALNRLHQLKVLDNLLSVEFARNKSIVTSDVSASKSTEIKNKTQKVENEKNGSKPSFKSCKFCKRFLPIAPHFGIEYFSNPGLKYKYPDPNADILLNICNALLTVPKFYTQTVHLMNKMNLYPPFTNVAIIPPVLLDYFSQLIPEIESVGSSESEIDSEEKDKASIFYDKLPPTKVTDSLKRKFAKFSPKRRLKVFENTSKVIKKSRKKRRRAFKKTKFQAGEKSILLNLPKTVDKEVATIVKTPIMKLDKIPLIKEPQTKKASVDNLAEKPIVNEEQKLSVGQLKIVENKEESGFGKIQPLPSEKHTLNTQSGNSEDYLLTFDFISERQLEKGQISVREMRLNPLFDKYSTGEPSCRLYIKNLAKKVTEKDLQFIYGTFVNFKDEIEKNMFNVRLMTKGRMKGQAFISLPTIQVARKALRLTNGYNLVGKPMVVVFGRSAKVKE